MLGIQRGRSSATSGWWQSEHPNPQPLSRGVSGEFQEPVSPRPCYLLFIHPWAMPSSVLFIEVFVQYGTGERELIASCPPVTLFTLMFTAPQFSIASRAPPFPANGEPTVSTGLGPI